MWLSTHGNRAAHRSSVKESGNKVNAIIITDGPENADAKDSSSNDPGDVLGLDEYKVDYTGSGVDLLQPIYAFELTLPYPMVVVDHSCIPRKMAWLITIRTFLHQAPVDECIKEYEDLLE